MATKLKVGKIIRRLFYNKIISDLDFNPVTIRPKKRKSDSLNIIKARHLINSNGEEK